MAGLAGGQLGFYFVQFLTGLASASSLFLVASGLSIIFGVTRVVNFAHGSFYMLGAFIAYSLVNLLPGGSLGFWGGVLLSALAVADGSMRDVTADIARQWQRCRTAASSATTQAARRLKGTARSHPHPGDEPSLVRRGMSVA